MVTAPSSPSVSSLVRKASRFRVLKNGGEVNYLIPLEVRLSSGGKTMDAAVLRYNLAKRNERIVDTALPVGMVDKIEIRRLDDDGNELDLLFFGHLVGERQTIDDTTEEITIDAKLDQFAFGVPCTGYYSYHPEDDATLTDHQLFVNHPLIFNPVIDHEVTENRSTRKQGTHGEYLILDPESMTTTKSQELQQDSVNLWKLSEAVHTLCWLLNDSEDFIKNPSLTELQNAIGDRDELLKDGRVRFGAHLPEALDDLLTPYGFTWCVIHSLESGERESTIRIIRRGEGVRRDLYLQRPGKQRDINFTNLASIRLFYSISDLSNRVNIYGDSLEREMSFALLPVWDAEHDELSIEELEVGQENAANFPAVGRKWAHNEAGDYTDLRSFIDNPTNARFKSAFGKVQSFRRRPISRCLSLTEDGDQQLENPIWVELYDADIEDAVTPDDPHDPGWVKVQWPKSILSQEIGCWFEGGTPPGELWNLISSAPEDIKLRITGTIRGDQRLKGAATTNNSASGRDQVLTLSMPHKFRDARVDSTSAFYDNPHSGRRDTDVIKEYAEKLLAIENYVRVSCSATLEGIDHAEFEIGNVVQKVIGRELQLSTGTHPLQVLGIIYHMDSRQNVDLLLEQSAIDLLPEEPL